MTIKEYLKKENVDTTKTDEHAPKALEYEITGIGIENDGFDFYTLNHGKYFWFKEHNTLMHIPEKKNLNNNTGQVNIASVNGNISASQNIVKE